MAAVALKRRCSAFRPVNFIFSEGKRNALSTGLMTACCHLNKKRILLSGMKCSTFLDKGQILDQNQILMKRVINYYLSRKELYIIQLLHYHLSAEPNCVINELWKHPKKKFISMDVVSDSLNFLLNKGFPKDVIRESLAVCFYPKENIEAGLEEIKKNESHLNKMGFINGFKTEKPSHNFPNAPQLLDTRLQLCLYYMELPFYFDGSGIFSINDDTQ